MHKEKLLKELRTKTQEAKKEILRFKSLELEHLNYKSSPNSWSILECIEHLCRYGTFYLPEIERRMLGASEVEQHEFKSGFIGNYFVNIINADSTKKMKATKEMDTTGSELTKSTLDQFIKQLDWLETLLIKAEKMDLTKIKTSISLTKLIKLRLGDTLRFLVHHNERHVRQALRIEKDFLKQIQA